MKSTRHLRGIHKLSTEVTEMYQSRGSGECYQAKTALTQGFIDVILLFKSYKGKRGETLTKFMCTYFLDELLSRLSHIRLRLITSSFEFSLSKALQIIFNYFLQPKLLSDTFEISYWWPLKLSKMANWIRLEKIELDIKVKLSSSKKIVLFGSITAL